KRIGLDPLPPLRPSIPREDRATLAVVTTPQPPRPSGATVTPDILSQTLGTAGSTPGNRGAGRGSHPGPEAKFGPRHPGGGGACRSCPDPRAPAPSGPSGL